MLIDLFQVVNEYLDCTINEQVVFTQGHCGYFDSAGLCLGYGYHLINIFWMQDGLLEQAMA